jgi:hypothetical protein
VIVGIFLAYNQIGKSRNQKERELKKRDREIKTQQAKFSLELRKMISQYDDVHRMLRDGNWPQKADTPSTANNVSSVDNDNLIDRERPSTEQWAALEAYMGFFEHCKYMLGLPQS